LLHRLAKYVKRLDQILRVTFTIVDQNLISDHLTLGLKYMQNDKGNWTKSRFISFNITSYLFFNDL